MYVCVSTKQVLFYVFYNDFRRVIKEYKKSHVGDVFRGPSPKTHICPKENPCELRCTKEIVKNGVGLAPKRRGLKCSIKTYVFPHLCIGK